MTAPAWHEALEALAVIAISSPLDSTPRVKGESGPAAVTALRVTEAARLLMGNTAPTAHLFEAERNDLLALGAELRT